MVVKRWWPIGQNRLIDSESNFTDGTRPISLFPFFDGQGEVRCLLAIDQNAGEVRVVPLDVEIRVPLAGTVRVATGWLELLPMEDVNLIHQTWHFDPMWKLDQPTLLHHPMRDALRETNCVNDFPWPVDNVYFVSTLKQVGWLHKHTKSENTWTRFKPNHLPPAPSLVDGLWMTNLQRPNRTQWVLNPIWMGGRSS